MTAELKDVPVEVRSTARRLTPRRAFSVLQSRSAEAPLPRAARWERLVVLSLLLLDIVVAAAAVGFGVSLRFGERPDAAEPNELIGFVLAPLWLALLGISRTYERDRINLSTKQFRAVFEAGVGMAAATVFLTDLARTQLSRGFIVIALPAGLLTMIAGRFVARAFLRRARRRGRCLHRVLAVGLVQDIEHLVHQLEGGDHHGMRVVAACAVGVTDRELKEAVLGSTRIPIVGLPAGARRAAAEVRADTVAVTSSGVLGREGLRRLAWQLEGSETGLLVTPELTDVAGPRVTIRPVGSLSLLQVSEPKFTGARRLAKSVCDRSMAAVALLACSVLVLVIAIAIKLDSRGAVFFRQTRSGIGGKPFRLVKFRSMVPTAEDLLIDLTDRNDGHGVLFKIRRDPRVTRVGRVLRRYSLDEVPQLWNVLCGHMSLVGPRPPLSSEVDGYGDDMRRRLLVKPGLTGLWQVSGRSDLSWEESVRLDLYYVENWSFALDLVIMARTVSAVLAGRGAY